jgi:hypothetical protein
MLERVVEEERGSRNPSSGGLRKTGVARPNLPQVVCIGHVERNVETKSTVGWTGVRHHRGVTRDCRQFDLGAREPGNVPTHKKRLNCTAHLGGCRATTNRPQAPLKEHEF